MKKILILLVVCLSLVSCGSKNRTLESLSDSENEQLNQLILARKNCIISRINELDNPQGEVKDISELVSWKCSHYSNLITSLLYDKFGVGLGKTYVFVTQMQNSTANEVTEAILAKRGERPVAKEPMEPRKSNGGDEFNYPMQAPKTMENLPSQQPAISDPQVSH